MLLAESCRVIASGLPDDNPLMASLNLRYMRERCRRVLNGFELFAFRPSALAVAADTRLDHPDQFEHIAEAVFRAPRKVFLEAVYAERIEQFRAARGFGMVELPEGRFVPARVGIEVDCKGDGKAEVGVLWNFSRKIGNQSLGPLAEMRGRTRLEREAMTELSRFGAGYCRISIDLERGHHVPRAEFEERFRQAPESFGQLDAISRKIMSAKGAHFDERRRVFEAWRMFHMNEISTIVPDPDAFGPAVEMIENSGQSIEEVMRDAERDLDGEIVAALSMLAAIDASGDALHREIIAARPASGRKPVSRKDLPQDRLAILSLNLSDKDLVRAVGGGASGGGGSGKPRVRHPVRGHLFRARNGRIVYRKPHWRGSIIRPSVTRVS